MSKLAERLRKRACKSELVEIDGEKLLCQGLSRGERGNLQSACRDKTSGKLDGHRLEGELLVRCALDPETKAKVFSTVAEWDAVPAEITGPLIAVLMRLNGFDEGELGKPTNEPDSTVETPTPN